MANQFNLDRQGSLSVFHEKLGLIITGANAKRQPELATFFERFGGQVYHMPISSNLRMSEQVDRLGLAYHRFFSELHVKTPSDSALKFQFNIVGKSGAPDEAQLNLQLCLKGGEILETGTGQQIALSAERIELSPQALGGCIRHRGWTLHVDPTARLVWPVYPHNPYTNAPEASLAHAVGVLSVPLRFNPRLGKPIRVGEQEIGFTLEVNEGH